MSQSVKRFSLLQVTFFGGAIATTTTLCLFSPVGCKPVRAEFQDSPKVVVDEVWQIVNRRYVDNTFNHADWQAIRQSLLSKNYTSRGQAYVAVQGALKKLGDRYTRFLAPKEYQNLREQSIDGEVSGIGIRMEVNEKTKQLTVVEALGNSPALKAGIKAGDRILAIDGKSTQGIKMEDVSKLIRGQVGTTVILRIGRVGQKDFQVKIARANIEVPKVSYHLKQEGVRRVGYIRLAEFSATAPAQMRKAILALNAQQVDGFVLDLRGNPGGLVVSSVEIARMWLESGEIVRTVYRVGGSEELKANQKALTKQPLVVLVDGYSASASEILTGALKDNKRAIVVGSQTFGKALVQALHPLSDGSGLAVTVGHYYTPDGTDISHKGIAPNVKIDLTDAQQRQLAINPALLGTQSDPQYTRAIGVLAGNFFTAESSRY